MSSSPFSEPVAGRLVEREREHLAGRRRHGERLEVDGEIGAAVEVDALHQLLHLLVGQLHDHHPDLGRVRAEDVAEGRRDDDVEAVVLQRPGGVLARGAAAEVAPGEQHPRARELGLVELEAGALVTVLVEAPVEERVLPVARALDPLQELLRDDLVGVDVGPVEHRHAAVDASRSPSRRHRLGRERADVDEVPVQRGRGGHLRADEVRPPATALAALEVPVRRRGAALARREDVGVHAEAHRAAGEAPLEPCVEEDLVETLRLRLPPHLRRARDDERGDARVDRAGRATIAAAARRSSMREFVHEPMKTRSIADLLDRAARPGGPCRRAPARAATWSSGSANDAGIGHGAGDRHDHARVRPPRHLRHERRRRRRRRACRRSRPGRSRASASRSTARSQSSPGGRVRPALEVGERRLVGRDHARRARPTRSSCCRSSSAAPSRGCGSPRPRTRRRSRRRRRRRPGRSRRGSCPSP